ncbi:long-chain fatty acid transport protein 4-like [Folsomia candida]|uniref:long-chain fatty acid transport protein 4-like n=1 Tax=Folsomia candida TaxID=158441 RepID=UPI001604B6FD|nr:long-chain fatty acid transport protein 4-like [Folsomia candida]
MDTSLISKFVDPSKIWEWVENFVHELPSNKGYVLLGGIGVWTLYKFIRNPIRFISIIRTIPRDFCALPTLFLLKRNLRRFQNGNYTIFQAFDETEKNNRNKILFQFNDFKMSAKEVQELSYWIANYFASQGYKKGDRVGIFMTNCAEYVPIWLGLSRIGVIGALINTNLRLTPLKHCIESVNCKAVIFTLDLVDAMNELLAECGGQLEGGPTLYTFLEGGTSIPMTFYDSFKSLNEILADVNPTCPIVKETIGFGDVAMFIFTSGTTGLPKVQQYEESRREKGADSNSIERGIWCLPNFEETRSCLQYGQTVGRSPYRGGQKKVRPTHSILPYFKIANNKKFERENWWIREENTKEAERVGEVSKEGEENKSCCGSKLRKKAKMGQNGLQKT